MKAKLLMEWNGRQHCLELKKINPVACETWPWGQGFLLGFCSLGICRGSRGGRAGGGTDFRFRPRAAQSLARAWGSANFGDPEAFFKIVVKYT